MAGVATLAGGALGGFLSALACRVLTTAGDGSRAPLADAMCGSFLTLGLVCLGTAVALGLVMVFGAWREGPPTEGQGAGVSPVDAAWLLIPAIILAATVVIGWLAAGPVVGLLARELPRNPGLGGVVLLPPGFMLGAIGTLALADLGMLLYIWARSPAFPRTYLHVAVAHVGLIACGGTVLDAVRSVSVPAGSELPLLQDVEAIVATSAQGLTWSLAARALGLPLLIPARLRALFRPRPPAARLEPRPAGSSPLVELSKIAGVPLTGPPTQAAPPIPSMPLVPAAPATGPLLGSRYTLRAGFLAWPLAGAITLDDTEHARTLKARVVPGPWPAISVWLETAADRIPIVAMQSRRLLGLGNELDVRDGLTHGPLATVKKPFAAEWLVYSPAGDLIAVITRTRSGFGTAEYIVRMGAQPVASFAWSNVVRPALEIDLSADTDRRFDRRLGIALSVIVFVNLSFVAR